MTCPHCKAMIKPGQLLKDGYHFNCFYKEKENDLPTLPRYHQRASDKSPDK